MDALEKNPALLAHTHCPGCGEHFRAVDSLIPRGAVGPQSAWICARCKAKERLQQANLVVVKCPKCGGGGLSASQVRPCPSCQGYGSVRVAEGELPILNGPRIGAPRTLTEG